MDRDSAYGETRCPVNGYNDTPSGVPLDCGYDTYFDAKTEAAEWLASWWNVGECENPFLVSNNGPNVWLNVGPSLGTRATSFTASLSETGNPDCDQITYRIDWGDGTITTNPSGSHTYATTGTKTITGTVTDQGGTGGSDTKTVQVCDFVINGQCFMGSGPARTKTPQDRGGSG